MESWENITIQWVNCLYASNNCLESIEELQDGKIYYDLIKKIIPWNSKRSNKNERDMVLQFLKDEYPNFPFKNENTKISKLCLATLVLSRLSLETIYHNMLIANLDVDTQIKIKSILEIVYSLDKSISEDDLYKVFSLSNKKDPKLFSNKPTFVLDDFIETVEPTEEDNIQMEQAKQIRQLKIQIETMRYENSDLLDDTAAQERQIKDLQNKLQETLTELKIAHEDNSKLNNTFMELKDKKYVESAGRKEVSLEKQLHKLQSDNCKLQLEKNALAIEVKQLYIDKCQTLKENNENKKKAIKLALLTKSQEKQINDLQNKLQENLRSNKSKLNNSFYTKEINKNALETATFKLKSLEKSLMHLKTKNYQLEQEKHSLVIDKLRIYKEKHYILKQKNENKKKAYEAEKLIKSQERRIIDLHNRLLSSEKSIINLRSKYQVFLEKRTEMKECQPKRKNENTIQKKKIIPIKKN